MDFEILPNGDLRIFLTGADETESFREELAKGYYSAEACVAETFQPNGLLWFIDPAAIGALTEAPILTNDAEYPDNSEFGPVPHPDASVWWFPNYMIDCPWETLAETGSVIFTLARAD